MAARSEYAMELAALTAALSDTATREPGLSRLLFVRQ